MDLLAHPEVDSMVEVQANIGHHNFQPSTCALRPPTGANRPSVLPGALLHVNHM